MRGNIMRAYPGEQGEQRFGAWLPGSTQPWVSARSLPTVWLLGMVLGGLWLGGGVHVVRPGHAAEQPEAADPEANVVLDKQAQLESQVFWDNRDWEWYRRTIPFFECPDADLTTTWYYRWELLTKHLTYGSPNSGYSFTEFIDRPFWSGTYGAISCPAGHQLYEARWLRDPRYAWDYARYWFRTPGAEPRRYSCWLADAVWAVNQVHPDPAVTDLLPDLVANYRGWEQSHYVPEEGLFWQTGHDDGMEININSRQTQDEVRGAPGYRPTLNSYLWADARAIAKIARQAEQPELAESFEQKAATIKTNLQAKLWDPRRKFFFHRFLRDEEKNGYVVKANTLTHETGPFAGSPHGRELIGYVPWQFGLPDAGYESAWEFLMDRDYFLADFGPTVTERHDPLFLVTRRCCVWSGQSWPYATTQTLAAMANLLRDYEQSCVDRTDYLELLKIYARTHRKDGRPYLAEAADPDTGSWEGYDNYNHSEHYFHSGFNDLIVTGLVGLRPRDDNQLEVDPLAPDDWDYFALDDVGYRGHRVSILWDRTGERYGLGRGMRVLVDGNVVAEYPDLRKIVVSLPTASLRPAPTKTVHVNFAVNNDLDYYPRATASSVARATQVEKVLDGNYWYHVSPPNRWMSAEKSGGASWFEVDFGIERPIHAVRAYWLDDGEDSNVRPPARVQLEYWTGETWQMAKQLPEAFRAPQGQRASEAKLDLVAARIRLVVNHLPGSQVGLTELECWGPATLPLEAAPAPEGNVAARVSGQEFPKVTASWTSSVDRREIGKDRRNKNTPTPHNRWTSYESPHDRDHLEVDFGRPESIARCVLHVYDDRGGVQPPREISLTYWDGQQWQPVREIGRDPEKPAGGRANTIRFQPLTTSRFRAEFVHDGPARSGLTEIEIWKE